MFCCNTECLEETTQLETTSQVSVADDEIRWDLVNRVRAQIEAGAYESPRKLDDALRCMLDEIIC